MEYQYGVALDRDRFEGEVETMQDISTESDNLKLSEPEQALARAVAAGEVADLAGAVVRAEIVRSIVFGRNAMAVVPAFGVRITNAIIEGALFLDACVFEFPLVLSHTKIQSGDGDIALTLRDASIRRLALHTVELDGAIHAERSSIEKGFIAENITADGCVLLAGARIGHTLSLIHSNIGNGTAALIAPGLNVNGSITLDGSIFAGCVVLQWLQLAGGFNASGAKVSLDAETTAVAGLTNNIALDLKSSAIEGDLLLDKASFNASLNMDNIRVGGTLEATDCKVDAVGGSWNMTGLNLNHSLCLDNADIKGVLQLSGADIGKLFTAKGASIDGGETAILADLIRIGGNLEMMHAKLVGQIRCPGAEIRGQLRLTAAKIYGSELAIRGDGSQIAGGCFLSRAFIVGLVRFSASRIGNQFRFRGATIKVEHGPALLVSGSHFARDVELNAGFETIGAIVLDQAEVAGVCDLMGSRLKSSAIARNASPTPSTKPDKSGQALDEAALSLVDARIGRLQMPMHGDERPRGIVNLSRARVGAFEDWATAWPPDLKRRGLDASGCDIDHLMLDGFVYDHLVNPAGANAERHNPDQDRAGQRRLKWLDGQNYCDVAEHFRPQPWVQLSNRLSAQGLASESRTVSIERRRRERRSHASTGVMRWESRLLDWIALFGFNPWRTVLWSLAVILLFAGFWSWASSNCQREGCFDQSIFVATKVDAYNSGKTADLYPPFSALGYAVDNFVPFIALGYADHWRPNVRYKQLAEIDMPNLPVFISGETAHEKIYTKVTITIGGILYFVSLLEQMIGLILVSLIATGFAGILRDET